MIPYLILLLIQNLRNCNLKYNFSYSKLIGRFDYESINKFIDRQYKG